MRLVRLAAGFFVCASMCSSALAVDLRLTGFGTIAYARSSERDRAFLRYIDRDGSAKADSVFGAQAEVTFNEHFGAVVQAVAAAPRATDEGYEAKVRWAFASFRPDNDWLIRVGRIRPPFFFNTQNSEVGVTYDQARLPVEVYAISPIYDFDGGSLVRSWTAGATEINAEAFWGKSHATVRGTARDMDLTIFERSRVRARGIVLSATTGQVSLRAGLHEAVAAFPEGAPAVGTLVPTEPFAPLPPPLGGTLYVPGDYRSAVKLSFFTLGLDWNIGATRVTAEFVNRDANSDTSVEAAGGYVTLAHRIGRWTPNVTAARTLSPPRARDIYRTVSDTPVPLAAQAPPVSLPGNYHRLLVDSTILTYDQRSIALGLSYSFSPVSKIKFEWLHSRVGFHSSYFDGDLSNKNVNIVTAAYSLSF